MMMTKVMNKYSRHLIIIGLSIMMTVIGYCYIKSAPDMLSVHVSARATASFFYSIGLIYLFVSLRQISCCKQFVVVFCLVILPLVIARHLLLLSVSHNFYSMFYHSNSTFKNGISFLKEFSGDVGINYIKIVIVALFFGWINSRYKSAYSRLVILFFMVQIGILIADMISSSKYGLYHLFI
ncbi:MAG: hypothetical protein A2268_03805 [Candidatus Raymondbacteria bacterium RifOxyA12_full_50_37]|uniref:Uncharacterized protein n=1 Tax=Candidatus Raymondbacteria bacterium RIFOXYD12_FULL_49_13 TaxID=1817890 RepID=A0A1F7FAS9_UNCRA|nr:MAG: hypothetical protein A2268_03805 [Candidatus Raymondbacteria bacterium RifOxyA12_full_50_37]OGJ92204.1 MAG: hypothetical protein A2350_14910 [Candidatus Raymondbacteria bacterium RifOxyB12_full_50_8]OGJ92649.1 MAG: hypothetical protein A2248_06145 [Candidatus Raymondbacteria bacterium RIFOXYA2_FULL_49_16]OGJ98003.1 MAG: hypothetical protein A2453_03170 [Candidatus Raymondbacteria bacterium RIFOXYC2_FULL_50_21]OGJ99867.1 MAG: hypothetical protein A2487_10970 [Candidatus Raymondbacteria b